jgi:hypothetical protein
MKENCRICNTPNAETSGHDQAYMKGFVGSWDEPGSFTPKPILSIKCVACGRFKIDEVFARDFAKSTYAQDRLILSGAIRSKNEKGIDVCLTSLDELRELYDSVSTHKGT